MGRLFPGNLISEPIKAKIMKQFNINIVTMILRFYLMMMVVIIAGFIGQWWLAILAFPIFLSSMLGFTRK